MALRDVQDAMGHADPRTTRRIHPDSDVDRILGLAYAHDGAAKGREREQMEGCSCAQLIPSAVAMKVLRRGIREFCR
jgi:hypothetical protein